MSKADEVGRRDFLAGMVGTAGGAAALIGGSTEAKGLSIPPDLDPHSPLALRWNGPVQDIAEVDLGHAAAELSDPAVQERHRIYSGLLMALVRRFWNGNNEGPVGVYPYRQKQREGDSPQHPGFFRYRGDRLESPDANRINWDRYLGHNIGCLAVDGNGEIIDFDFNHNNIFRSSAEHAEARIVRRLFSLTSIFDNWNTGTPIPGKSRAFSLQDVTIYTSLESCAQCSGVMSLGRVKQVVYLQNDPGAYRIGNIMFNLAGVDGTPSRSPLAALPIRADAIGMDCLRRLNTSFASFASTVQSAGQRNDTSQAYFVPPDGRPPDYAPSITSFLCTDTAYDIFNDGAESFFSMQPAAAASAHSSGGDTWDNHRRLAHARDFYAYADREGYRGSPHKL